MKLIIALIKPFKLDAVREALGAIGVEGMIVDEMKGFGRQKGHTEVFRGTEYEVEFVPRVRLEVAVGDEQKDAVVDAILKAARTGSVGDGRVFVVPLEDAIRITTGQHGDSAL
ncbi:MAG: P-II family nitrogen regulator [Opitutae bacterium]|nr:P-II family nitrogen regulator [Opitutae bacterium]